MITAPFEAITMKVTELRHLFDKAEASWRRALAERRGELAGWSFVENPEVVGEIGASAERIEAALDDLFIMRAAYVFDDERNEVRVPIQDVLNLLLETDFF